MKNQRGYQYLLKIIFLAIFSNIFATNCAYSAEKIYLVYGSFKFSLPVESLEKFADEGTIDKHLNPYFKKIDTEQQGKIRVLLNQQFTIKPFAIYQLSKTYAGSAIINLLGKSIQIPGGSNGYYAIRGSLIQSALAPEGLSIMNFIRNFPTDIEINVAHVLKTSKKITTLIKDTENFINYLKEYESVQLEAEPIWDASQSGTLELTKQVRHFQDVSRQRDLRVAMYIPKDKSNQIPVILISSGLGANIDRFESLGNYLSSHGFAVIIVDHPQSNYERQQAFYDGFYQEPFEATEFINRPLDVSFILDQLEEINVTEFSEKLQLDKVGIFGYSFGVTTAFSLAGAQINWTKLQKDCPSFGDLSSINISLLYQCRALELSRQDYNLEDKRIRAIFGFLPFGSILFGDTKLSNVDIPVFLQTTNKDLITPLLVEQLSLFTWIKSSDKYLVIAKNLAHSRNHLESTHVFNNRNISETEVVEVTRNYLNKLTFLFFNSYLGVNQQYSDYLNSENLDLLEEDLFDLYLIKGNDQLNYEFYEKWF
jgi:predicted dienelactone hydrolase